MFLKSPAFISPLIFNLLDGYHLFYHLYFMPPIISLMPNITLLPTIRTVFEDFLFPNRNFLLYFFNYVIYCLDSLFSVPRENRNNNRSFSSNYSSYSVFYKYIP